MKRIIEYLRTIPLLVGLLPRRENGKTFRHSSNDELEKEGFVTHILRNNVKFFRSINPEHLIEKAEEKQKEIIGLAPILKSLKTESNNDYATIYEGRNGFKQAFEANTRINRTVQIN